MAVTEVALHLHAPPSPSHRTFLLLHARRPILHLHCRPISVSDHRLLLLFRQLPNHISRCRRWDSNAESYSSKSFKSNDTNEIEESDDEMELWVEALEDYIDSIWILKVFGSYGWMLPPIVISLLLANGLKAFLLALALPIGQSTFAFAIRRFQNKPKRRNKAKKRRSSFYSSRDAGFEESQEFTYNQASSKKQKGYQSWVSKDDSTVNSNGWTAADDLGGWDELDSGTDYNVGASSTRASKKSSRSRGTSSRKKGESRKSRESDGPLLLSFSSKIEDFRAHIHGLMRKDWQMDDFSQMGNLVHPRQHGLRRGSCKATPHAALHHIICVVINQSVKRASTAGVLIRGQIEYKTSVIPQHIDKHKHNLKLVRDVTNYRSS